MSRISDTAAHGAGRGAVLLALLLGVCLQAFAGAPRSGAPGVALGEIPERPIAPEFPFERFLQTRPLAQLAFAADNRSLYLLTRDGRVQNVFAIDLASGALRQVTHFDEPVNAFVLDHAGRFLIIAQDSGGNENFDLFRFDLVTGARKRLTDAGRGDTTILCGLSPDDRLLDYAQTRNNRREAGLWQVELSTGRARELLAAKGRTYDCGRPSADGRYLLFGELIGFDEHHLGVLDLRSGEPRFIARAPGVNNVDAWFAGDQVYFLSALGADRFRLWRVAAEGGAPALVELPFDNDLNRFTLYAGGRVAVLAYRDALAARTGVFVDGFETLADFGLPAASVVDAVFSDSDPNLGVIVTETASSPPRYHLVRGQAPVLLYDANRSGIDNRLFAEVRSLLIPSFDGLQIPVHLFIPNGTSARTPRPALLLIHGGPEEHIDPVYLSVVQFLANRGFIVVVPNVRGSTGFGKRYAALDNDDWGGGHIRDSVAVAAAVKALDFVDGRNLFVAGESFGGFSVMSLITQYPDTFRAAVDLFGFTELASFVASWPRYLQRNLFVELGFDPRADERRNRQLSPLYHVERIRIPVQIHQGANDSRVPRAQADWLVQRMRALGQRVEYYVYPDEGHGFTRVDNEAQAWQRVVRFLRRYTALPQRPGDGATLSGEPG